MPDRPDWRDEIRRRLEPLDLTATREAEIVEEVAQHLDDRYRELRASGRPEEDAAVSAWRELDETDVLGREIARIEVRAPLDLPPPGAPARGRWLSALWQDVRYGCRTLRRSPGFSMTVLLAVALTIGPTTAILSIGNWLFWRPHPGVADPDRLAVVWFGDWTGPTSVSVSWVTDQNLVAISRQASAMTAMVGVQELSASLSISGTLPNEVGTAHVGWDFFDVLGVRMRAGRGFVMDEAHLSASPVAVIGEALARQTFPDPAAALGKLVFLNSRPFTVVGIAPAAFQGLTPTSHIAVWIPAGAYGYLNHYASSSPARFYSFVARLRPDAGVGDLQRQLDTIVPRLDEDAAGENDRFGTVRARVYPRLGLMPLMRPYTSRTVRTMMLVGFVLIVLGCANVANLLIFRTTRRAHEIAVRKAIGATASRLVQVQLAESCALALGGAAIGIALAVVLKELIQHLLFPRPPGMSLDVPLDLRVLGMTMAAAVGTGVAAGAAPAWIAVRAGVVRSIAQAGVRTATRAPRLRGALGALQLALSLALLVGALLLVTTLRNLHAVDLGLDPHGVTAFGLDLSSHGYSAERSLQYYRAVLPALEARGEFEAVALAEATPFGSGEGIRIVPPRDPLAAPIRALSNTVTDDYFRLLRIPILRGRGFSRDETLTGEAKPIAIVNETVARTLYGRLDVIGEPIRLQHMKQPLTIVGVARDSYWRNITDEAGLFVYLPLGGAEIPDVQTLVRSPLPAAAVADVATSIVARVDARVPLSYVRPLTSGIDRELANQRLFAWVLSLLAGLGFVLASLGLFALVAQSATERAREFGIRLALGATRRDIARLVARYAFAVTSAGVLTGLALAWFGTRAVDRLLFGITRLDPAIYLAAVVTLIAAVALACVAPVWRATRVEPVEVLRAE